MTICVGQRDQKLIGGVLILLTLAFAVIQIALTWSLWTGESSYPQVPFLSPLVGVPKFYDDLLTYLLTGLLLLQIILKLVPNSRRLEDRDIKSPLFMLTILCWVSLLLLNQHRFQPWAYQVLIWLTIFRGFRGEQQRIWIIRFTASIYIFSAISKLDASFLDHHGQQLLDGFLQSIHLEAPMSETARWWMIGSFPLGELIIGISLLIPYARSSALLSSCCMHVALLLTLGPWGLNHQWPVLIWNLFFILQNGYLCWQCRQPCQDHQQANHCRRFSSMIYWIWLLLPLGNMSNHIDLWPSWGLYASRSENVRFYLHAEEIHKVPENIKPWIGPEPFDSPWCRVQLHQWSLKATNAPPYPATRFALGTIRGILDQLPPEAQFQVILEGLPNRWSGYRKTWEIGSLSQLDEVSSQFVFNSEPRIH